MLYNKRVIKTTARTLLLVLAYQLGYPSLAMALTTGPSQPEVLAFEPVGTTDMVDMFSGDFVYNIPLLDIEGYPVNIAYHAGVGMEDEASWVGLGWNINPGAINRAVRGVPDDFNGEKLTKELNIKEEKTIRIGAEFGGEVLGVGDPLLNLSLSLGNTIGISNYRGISADVNIGVGIRVAQVVSAGVNFGVGSQTGADVDIYAGVARSSSTERVGEDASGVGFSITGSHGYNTRSGLKDITLSAGFTGTQGVSRKSTESKPLKGSSSSGITSSGIIPIGLKNYVPVITNSSTMRSTYGRLKIGGEALWSNAWWAMKGSVTSIKHQNDGSRKAFGYLYAQNADQNDIHDFSRDKDGMYNRSMKYLPMATHTYDVYSINGQGTGGSFRPVRNDYGSVFDPVVKSPTSTSASIQAEASLGWLFAFGTDGSFSQTNISSGPWGNYQRQYAEGEAGSLYEPSYMKQAGDISAIDDSYWSSINGTALLEPNDVLGLPFKKAGYETKREPRSGLVYFFNADEIANNDGVGSQKYIYSYEDTFGIGAPTVESQIDRNTGVRKGHQISELVQVQGDGRRYVYGLPAMNNIQREATFTIGADNAKDETRGLTEFSDQDNSTGNTKGIDHYYSSTITPGHTHSYLLTSVLSADYVDLTNNGPSNDDLGSYSKFNYKRTSSDYRWRAPYKAGWGQHDKGFLSDPWDDKASYLIGSREQWLLHSIESKNFIAEFYTSPRLDGKGVTEKIPGGGVYNATASDDDQLSYKLDSIKLYNKHDRFINKTSAVPIKTIFFEYDYSLCKGIPNTSVADTGKLTLKKIYTRYGNSNKSIASPYQFNYSDFNPDYNEVEKDRWGSYKVNGTAIPNNDYPFVDQLDTANNTYAGAWSLDEILLPSGGVIKVDYEADDYAYVQDKRAMEMFKVEGIGNSTTFGRGNQLYYNENSPAQYLYFKRRADLELASKSPKENYLSDGDVLYFNCNVKLRNNQFEQIKGYAKVATVGYSNDDYGYVQLSDFSIVKSKSKINAITYTALNVGRYHLPHIIYDGFDPNIDPSKLKHILAGMKQGFSELLSIFKNPIDVMVKKKNMAKVIDLSKSYVRLSSPGLKKKGGGHRVKQLTFYDSWAGMAGGDAQNASYGKQYDYTKELTVGSGIMISSGVASYEPFVGGDENPLRLPIPYIVQSGSNFPPHEPVSLYQEMPLGESFYPPAMVGYSKVTVSSIHKEVGRSAQAVEEYQYYTAKDYPIKIDATPINTDGSKKPKFSLFVQENKIQVQQGYTVTLNDMHGKPKSVATYEQKVTGDRKLKEVSRKTYKYDLDNTVDVLVNKYHDSLSRYIFTPQTAKMGYDIDITLDTRQKIEHTDMETINLNVNTTNVLFVPVPIPWIFPWYNRQENEFRSAVATKVVQRYGLLEEVVMYDEGAQTILRNEVYDPNTGQPIMTSLNNEFGDKEYSLNYPAYWGYKTMGAAYHNTGYTDHYSKAMVYRNYLAPRRAVIDAGSKKANFNEGDEVLMRYTYNNGGSPATKSIIGYIYFDKDLQLEDASCCSLVILPKYKDSANYVPGWDGANQTDSITDIHLKVLRSGRKNMLNESIVSYTTMYSPIGQPISGSITIGGGGSSSGPFILNDSLSGVIELVARAFSESRLGTTTYGDSHLDDYANGKRGVYRLAKEYTYQTPRSYATGRTRTAGIFYAASPWKVIDNYDPTCPGTGNLNCVAAKSPLTASYLYPDFSSVNWKLSREVSKWSPFGAELENRDAVNNYSSLVYGYNEELPVAVAYNAKQGEILFDGFEDYLLLQVINNFMYITYSPFKSFFPIVALAGSTGYGIYNITSGQDGTSLQRNPAHSGMYALKSSTTQPKLILYKRDGSTDGQYVPFTIQADKKYIISYWSRPVTITHQESDYSSNTATVPNVSATKKSKIIDYWQQVEYEFATTGGTTADTIKLPANCYIDDIRVYPIDANMKSFVYNPINERLMATLDENNYTTFYEYDQEGNLVRTKRETENGIITISESRSANTKR